MWLDPPPAGPPVGLSSVVEACAGAATADRGDWGVTVLGDGVLSRRVLEALRVDRVVVVV